MKVFSAACRRHPPPQPSPARGEGVREFGRRGFLAGAATLAASPALAQFNIPFGGSRGGVDFGRIIGGASDLFQDMNLGEADEIRMGETFYGSFVDRSGGPYRNRAAQAAIAQFADPILRTSQRPSLPWEFVLLDDDTVNAWALPGGKLGINKGLVRYCADPAELAAVIAHEVGHAELSHALQQMRSESFTKGLTQVGREVLVSRIRGAGGALTGSVLDALRDPIYQMITSGYSQSSEFAADAHVLHVYELAGYQPAKASGFFRTLLQLIPPDAQATTSLFSTHPGTRERIARIDAAARSARPPALAASERGWAELKSAFPTRRVYRRMA
jgi:predicted Zn-dependent protease